MEAAVFGARLDLLVRLIDTTTGAAVNERNVLFMRDERQVQPESRGDGIYLFINTGREDFLMRIRVTGFDEYVVRVKYGELDPRIPECNVFLIPSENTVKGESVLSLSGNLPFLEALEAVSLSKIVCSANEYDPKKNILRIFSSAGARVSMDNIWYGLLRPDKTSYEKIRVLGNETPQSIALKSPLEEEFTSNQPICRIIFGQVNEDGDYLLRVRDDGADQLHLLRYVVNGKAVFKEVDFHDCERISLEAPAERETPEVADAVLEGDSDTEVISPGTQETTETSVSEAETAKAQPSETKTEA